MVRHHKAVELTLHVVVNASHGPHAGDVAGIVVVVGSAIDQHQVSGAKLGVVGVVVAVPGMVAARHDGPVRHVERAVVEVGVAHDGVELMLAHAGTSRAHRLVQTAGAEGAGPPQ